MVNKLKNFLNWLGILKSKYPRKINKLWICYDCRTGNEHGYNVWKSGSDFNVNNLKVGSVFPLYIDDTGRKILYKVTGIRYMQGNDWAYWDNGKTYDVERVWR